MLKSVLFGEDVTIENVTDGGGIKGALWYMYTHTCRTLSMSVI